MSMSKSQSKKTFRASFFDPTFSGWEERCLQASLDDSNSHIPPNDYWLQSSRPTNSAIAGVDIVAYALRLLLVFGVAHDHGNDYS
jgi:hypothetical protein